MGTIYFCLGLVLGAVVMNLAVEEEKRMNKRLMKVINNLQDEINAEVFKKEQRDLLIKQYQDEHEILLMNAKELRAKITELENKKELVNNLDSAN